LKYGSREALDGCKILLPGVGTICPPGKHHSENFPKSLKIEKCAHFFVFVLDLGILLTGPDPACPTRLPEPPGPWLPGAHGIHRTQKGLCKLGGALRDF
jgi:hypothetical protein